MISDEIRQKLQNIVRGDVLEGQADHCTAIRNLLSQSFGSNPTVKKEFESRSILKEEQAHFLKAYTASNRFWMPTLPEKSQYLTRGGESEVYLSSDYLDVIKINDGIYYATWTEYFNSLIVHNLFFLTRPTNYLALPVIKMKCFVRFSGNLSLKENKQI